MNYRKILKNMLRVVVCTIAGLVVAWIGLFVYLSKPYIIEIDEVRTTGKIETIRASWGHACGEEFIDEGRPGTRLNLVVPEGVVTPGDTDAAVSDNIFIITGYRYKSVQKNLLNGEVNEIRSQRIDVIKWHVIPPYKVHTGDGARTKEISRPLGWQSQELEPTFTLNNRSEAGGC